MTVDGRQRGTNSGAIGFEAQLAEGGGPAWVIDSAEGRVLASNDAGTRLLGLTPGSQTTLDATMPALVRLREVATEREGRNTHRESLTFWTSNGVERLFCNLRRLPAPGRSPVFLVSVVTAIAGETTAESPKRVAGGEASASDDASTLRKIALAIRSGRDTRDADYEVDTEASGGTLDGARQSQHEPQVTADHPSSAPHYTAKLAHELKTPLSAIVAAAEIIKDERFGPIANDRYVGYVTDIHESARHALDVINAMLAERPHGTDKPGFTFAEIDLNAVAAQSVSTMRPLAEQAGLRLASEFAPRLPHVIADAMCLKQILLNLLGNAVKFTYADGDVTVLTGRARNGSVWLAVRDTGSGMSRKDIDRILAAAPLRNRQEHSENGGLGIGLPLVRSLAEANGARFAIDSTRGKGTTATISFPKDRVVPV